MVEGVERVEWTCPICGRRYAIPASAPTPARCPQCRDDRPQAASGVNESSTTDEPLAFVDQTAPLFGFDAQPRAARRTSSGVGSRHRYPVLRTLEGVFTAFAGLSALAGLAGLIFGLQTVMTMAPNAGRTAAIWQSIAGFVSGAVAAVTFYAFGQLIRVVLEIEEHTRPRSTGA